MPRHYSVGVIPSSTHPEQTNNSKTLREMSEAVMDMSRDKHKQEISLYRWDHWQEGTCLHWKWKVTAPSSSNLWPLTQEPLQHILSSTQEPADLISSVWPRALCTLKLTNLEGSLENLLLWLSLKRLLPRHTGTCSKKIKKEKPLRKNTPRRWEDHLKKSLE